jgi:type I restriction enzyme S subunit
MVAGVDELMALCDRLEASLPDADDTRHRLLDALLQEALSETSATTSEEAA